MMDYEEFVWDDGLWRVCLRWWIMKSLSEMMDYEEFVEQRATNNHTWTVYFHQPPLHFFYKLGSWNSPKTQDIQRICCKLFL